MTETRERLTVAEVKQHIASDFITDYVVVDMVAAYDEQAAIAARFRELLQAVQACEVGHDEHGLAFLKVPARSMGDLAAEIAGVLAMFPAPEQAS